MDAKENSKKKQLAPPKLKLLFTIVNREKTELYTALIQGFNVNMQLSTAARGTASREIMQMLGLSDKNKSLIVSVIREDTEDMLLRFLDEKFHTRKNGKCIACTVSMSSVIGVAVYRFLGNYNEGRM